MKLPHLTTCVFALFAMGCKSSEVAKHDMGNSTNGVVQGQQSATEPDFGVPIYPGSAAFEIAGADSKVPGAEKAVSSHRSTPDSDDKVIAFYKQKLPSFEVSKTGEATVFVGKDTDGKKVAISVTKDGTGSKIVIVNMG